MSLIKVGIHEDLTITSKTQINEHGTLELFVASVQSADAVLSAIMSNEVFQSMESCLRMYPPSMLDFDKKPNSAAEIAKELMVLRHQLSTYGELFATKEEVKAAIGDGKMFEGLGIPPEDYGKAVTMLTQEAFMLKVYKNLVKKFYDFGMSKKAFDGNLRFRQKFLRQSDIKNYATISKSDFDVWLEPMSIPKSASKIAYSDYEISKKKHLSHPIASDAGKATAADTVKAAALFNTANPATEAPKPDLFKDNGTPATDKPSAASMFTTPGTPE